MADQKNLVYYFETALTPNTFWVDLKLLNFQEGSDVIKLDLTQNKTYSGESSAQFVSRDPFRFMGL